MIFNKIFGRYSKACMMAALAGGLLLSGKVIAGEAQQHIVRDAKMLQKSIEIAKPGDEIIMANGVWKDVAIRFDAHGAEGNPVTLRAESPGKVSLEGASYLALGGEYLVVSGLLFQNGHTPTSTVINFKIGKDSIANHCRVTSCVIIDYNKPERFILDHWVEFWGRHNTLDHCYLAGKSNEGPTLLVNLAGNENVRNFHEIKYNYFGPRPRKGGPKAETIRMGSSYTSMTPAHVQVTNNFFEHCNGEVEVISNKSNDNVFRNNIFYESEGSLVLRHGNYCTVDGNIFIGNHKPFVGGIRVINTGHWITNNYFYAMYGNEFRAPLAIMNGIPKSPLNRYNQVTDVVVAHNTWVDCPSPWQFSVGVNADKKDVLPASEIRSARPIRTILANNLIYNHQPVNAPVVAYDKVDGISFENNLIDNGHQQYDGPFALQTATLKMQQLNDWLYISEASDEILKDVYRGFDFENIKTDLFGNGRNSGHMIGAICNTIAGYNIDRRQYGAPWFLGIKNVEKGKVVEVSSRKGALRQALSVAKAGDVIVLSGKKYTLDEPLAIDKYITIRAKSSSKPVLQLSKEGEGVFALLPGSHLHLESVNLIGNGHGVAFSTATKGNNANYDLFVSQAEISGFGQVLKAYKGSFADTISFSKTVFSSCDRGIYLAAETDDKGDYNAEVLSISGCTFQNIGAEVINYYRGGYDESTIGGSLVLKNNSITDCGKSEEGEILIGTHGIINVLIEGNKFKDNSPAKIAVLWGEKNNHARDNQVENSGEIVTEKYLKQKQIY